MTDLKTLKDIENESDRPEMVEPDEIREVAKEWIQQLEKENGVGTTFAIKWIIHFFNLDSEETK